LRLEDCLREISERLEPSVEEKTRLEREATRVTEALWRALELAGRRTQVSSIELQGSFARDTWLPGDVDIDIFLLFEKGVGLETLQETTRIVSRLAAEELGASLQVRYASHPYYVLKLESIEVEVVPAYKTSSPAELISPVDRTPHHTAFIRSALSENPQFKADIRLFKKLLKNIGVYGAETWVGGFSGFLAEILVVHYGGLVPLLRAAAGWKPGKTFIPEGVGEEKFRGAPLVVLDPVDPERNAAAAVSQEAMLKLIAVARLATLKEELLCCFLEPPELAPDDALLQSSPESRSFLFIAAEAPPGMPLDAAKGKLARILRKLRRALEREGFTVYRQRLIETANSPLLALELESGELPQFKKHLGPPVWSPNSISFLEKWVSRGSGPYVEGKHWVVVAPRKTRRAEDVVSRVLSSYEGVRWELLDFGQVVERCRTREDRRKLYSWLTGVEEWMLCLQK